jgi:hypothetical protein
MMSETRPMTDRPREPAMATAATTARRWCVHCQCYHDGPKPAASTCARAARQRGEHRTGMVRDMLDYN